LIREEKGCKPYDKVKELEKQFSISQMAVLAADYVINLSTRGILREPSVERIFYTPLRKEVRLKKGGEKIKALSTKSRFSRIPAIQLPPSIFESVNKDKIKTINEQGGNEHITSVSFEVEIEIEAECVGSRTCLEVLSLLLKQ